MEISQKKFRDLEEFYKRQRKQSTDLVVLFKTQRSGRFTLKEINTMVSTSFIGISFDDVVDGMGYVVLRRSKYGDFYSIRDVLRGVENALEGLRVKY